MPVATITIQTDEQSSVAAMNNLTGAVERLTSSMDKAGAGSNRAFGGMTKDHQQARQSANLLANALGIQLPRAIEQVITQSAGMRAALIGALNITSTVGLAIFGIQQVLAAIDFVQAQIQHFSDGSKERAQEAQNNGRQIFHESIEAIKQLQEQTAEATAGEIKKIQIKLAADLKEIDSQIETQTVLGQQKTVEKLQQVRQQRLRLAEAQEVSAQRSITDQTVQLQNQATLSALTGTDAIIAKMNQEIAAQETIFKRGLSLREEFEARKVALTQAATNQITRMQLDADAQGIQAQYQADAQGLAGQEQLEAQHLAQVQQIHHEEEVSHLNLNNKLLAADTEYHNKSLDLERQRMDELQDLETETAIAILPPWQRADAQIVADAENRIRQIRELMEKDKTFEAQGQREITLIWQQEMHQRVENMGNQMEGLFDEITSGGIAKFFLNKFKHLVFEMVAQWIVGMTQMRAASSGAFGSGGGGFLSSIAGLGGSGGGPGGTPPFLAGLFGGGGSGGGSGSASIQLPGGAVGLGLDNLPVFSGQGGATVLSGLGLSAGQGAGGLGTILPSGSGAGGAAGGLGGFLGKLGGLSGITSLLTFGGGALLGSKNLALKSIGGLLLGGGLGAGISAAIAGTSLGALLGPLGAFLGPIGAVAGLLIPLIAGLFGKSTKKARLEIEAQMKRQSEQVEEGYKLFQTDWSGATGQLESLRTQGVDALQKAGVKDISRSRVGHVDHWIDKAEKEINAIEAERQRRSQLVFGPAQFHIGGMVRPELAFLSPGIPGARTFHSGGEVNANLLVGEGVLTQRGVRNAGGPAGVHRLNNGGESGGEVHIHVHALDSKDFGGYLRKGGARAIVRALRRAELEGGA